MYYVSKKMEIAGAHQLKLPYNSPCQNLHGHNWFVTIYCKSPQLTEYGMVVDFTKVKQAIHDKLDHKYINDVLPGAANPTAENIAKWVCDTVDEICQAPDSCCYKVEVQESEGNVAIYTKGDSPEC